MNIKKLRQKYNLSQQELARRLGMSRYTLIKIEQGKRDLAYDEQQKIKDIFGLLTDSKDKKKDLDMRINIPQKNIKKFKEVLIYILQKVGAKPNVGQTVLYKLLYFIDFDYYERYERQLMGLSYIKNHHGPSPRQFVKLIQDMKKAGEIEEVRSKYFKLDQRKYLPLRLPKLDVLEASELQVIDQVLAKLADMNAKEISQYVHGDVPWYTAEQGEDIDYE
ncbi:XRE family transcriptional regulator, partial [Candidatus Shapirobacteria bacterium]